MDGKPLPPAASPSDSCIVIDCPTCHRTIWDGATCHHGAVPLEPTGNNEDAGVLVVPAPKAGRKGGTER
jgi:hypothetical protein